MGVKPNLKSLDFILPLKGAVVARAKVRIAGTIDSTVARQVTLFHQLRLVEARKQGIPLLSEGSNHVLRWGNPPTPSLFYTFSATFQLLLERGLAEAKKEKDGLDTKGPHQLAYARAK